MRKMYFLFSWIFMILFVAVSNRDIAQSLTKSNFTGVYVPQYIFGSTSGFNNNRLQFVFRATISGLTPNATYRFYNLMARSSDFGTTNSGAGTLMIMGSTYVFSSNTSLATAGQYGEFTTDNSGNYTGWFCNVTSTNARFTPGNYLYPTITINDGAGGGTVTARYALNDSIKVMTLSTSSGANDATAILGNSSSTPKNVVLLYDNVYGTGRPLSMTYVEDEGQAPNNILTFYSSYVNTKNGAWGTIIPNNNANGVRRIEQRSLTDGSLVGCAADNDGIWSTGPTNTVNPTSGTSALEIYNTDAPLANCIPSIAIASYKVNRARVKQGSDTVILYNLSLFASTTSGQLDTIKFKTAGNYMATDIKTNGFKLWSSVDNYLDNTDVLVDFAAATGPGTIVFDNPVTLPVQQYVYLFVTADISMTAQTKDSIYINTTNFNQIIINNGNKGGINPLPAAGAKTIILFNSPELTASSLATFGRVIFHTTSAEKSFTINGKNLVPNNDTITITPPPNFEVSFTSGSGFSATKIKKAYTGGTLPGTTVYVIFKPTAVTYYYNSIKISGGDTMTLVPVSGEGLYPDTIAPRVDTAYALSDTKVLVKFSEAVDNTGIAWANYNGLNMFNSVTIRPSRDTVYLNLAVPLTIEATYILTVSGVQDTSRNHNKMITQNCTIKWGRLPLYKIRQINHVNAKGMPDSNGVACKLTGIVQSINYTNNGLKFFIHDKTGGICVYRSNNVTPYYSTKMGDSIRVAGIINTNQGLCQIQIDSLTRLDSFKLTNVPVVVSKPVEASESEVIKIKNLSLTNPTEWPTFPGFAKTVHAYNGYDTILIRIESRCNLQGTPRPGPIFELTGIGSQIDADTPYLSSYYIVPRNTADMVIIPGSNIPLVINELTAAPTATDPWIELYNPNSTKISLKKFHLSDDTNTKAKYTFPDSTSIPAMGYLLLYDNTHPANPGYHVNFTLNSAGGQLIFTDSSLKTRDYIEYGKQKTDTSFSRIPNGTGVFMFSKMTPTAVNIPYPPNYTIAQVTTVNANGVVDSLNTWCKISGVVYSINYFQLKPGYKFNIHDGTGGICIYKTDGVFANYPAPKMGDRIYVTGIISQLNGLSVMNALEIEFIDSNSTLNSPLVVTSLNENTEGEFVRINSLSMIDAVNFPWPKATDSTRYIKAKNGTDTFLILIEVECKLHGKWGVSAPQKVFDILGIGWQLDKTNPYTSSYMVCPRLLSDLRFPDAVEENSNFFNVYPNPSPGTFNIENSEGRRLTVTVYNTSGQVVLQKISSENRILLQAEQKPGLYLVKVNDTDGHTGTVKLIIK